MRIWIPPEFTTNYKFEVKRSDDSVDDLTDIAHMIEIEDGVTDIIGRFKFEVWDVNETYKNAWTGLEEVSYYSDYATSATTKRFLGLIEKVSHRDNKIIVTGRSYAVVFIDKKVTGSFSDIDCSDILKNIISLIESDFDVTGIETSGILLTVEWQDKPFWEAFRELARAANFDGYVNASKAFQFFEVGSRSNTTDAIMTNYNLISVGDFGEDITQVRNKIRVYGATQENGIQIMYTAEDTASQAAYLTRVEVISDDNVLTYAPAKDLGDFWLAKLKDPPVVGDVTGALLATIQPGEKLWIGSPENNLSNRDPYQTQSYKHTIGDRGLMTTVTVEKSVQLVSHVLRGMIERENSLQDTSKNPNDLNYSYNFSYSTDSGTHTNTEITNDILKLITGQSSGTWISASRTADVVISEVRLLMFGQTLDGASVQVSADDGLNYHSISNFEKISIIQHQGLKLRVKVAITDTSTQLTSLSLQYT